jgi:hypothetical protein
LTAATAADLALLEQILWQHPRLTREEAVFYLI